MEPDLNDRRTAPRLPTDIRLAYSVGGGPQRDGAAINLTDRSLAIRGEGGAAGETVSVWIGAGSPFEGRIARVWGDGFAVDFGAPPLALVEVTRSAFAVRSPREAVTIGSFFRLDSDRPAFGRFVRFGADAETAAIRLMIVLPGARTAFDTASKMWLTVGDGRWSPRSAAMRRRADKAVLHAVLADWQLALAAKHGLGIAVVGPESEAWRGRVSPEHLAANP